MIKILELSEPDTLSPLNDVRSLFTLELMGVPLGIHIARSFKDTGIVEGVIVPEKLRKKHPDIVRSILNILPEVNGNDVLSGAIFHRDDGSIELKMPWDLFPLLKVLLDNINGIDISEDAKVDDSAIIEGNVSISQGAKVSGGSILRGNIYIGENAFIGDSAMIRGNVCIERDVSIGFSTEIKNSIIQQGTHIGPLVSVLDSYVGVNCNLGALTRTSNNRFDEQTIKVIIGENEVETGRRKLGVFIGDNVKVGAFVLFLPGRKVSRGVFIDPKIVVKNNLKAGTRYILKQELNTVSLESNTQN